ncbi:MAG: hypothetical protein K1X55_12065 [Chitinophagales bacterium]|nr:hypothetical protein [Chitinophagales bacterium]
MLKDLGIKKVEDVAIALVPEDETNCSDSIWTAYVVNLSEKKLAGILVNSRGYGDIDGENKKTSTLRWLIDEVPPFSVAKIEELPPDLLQLANEFWVSFYVDGEIYDKKYVFVQGSLVFENLIDIPYLNDIGVMIK